MITGGADGAAAGLPPPTGEPVAAGPDVPRTMPLSRMLPAGEVMRITAETTEFKFNCAVANIDFFIRHGLIAPDHPDYVEMLRGMHR